MTEMQTLKVEFEGDLRRLRLKLPQDIPEVEKLHTIREAIRHGFSWSDDEHMGVTLKYKDEEGDLCTLVEATVEDFLAQPGSGPLRLVATRPPPATPSRAPEPPAVRELAAATVSPAAPAAPDEPMAEAAPRPSPAAESASGSAAPSAAGAAGRPCSEASGCNDAFGSEASFTASHPSFTCGSSVGPWKLLMCLRGLWDAQKMSAKMVGSMMLQFLPILAQRAHRKQEKLNRLGPSKREELLPLLRCVSAYIERVPEAAPLKSQLEDFISGRDVTKLGDFLAVLFKTLAMSKDRHGVAEAINGVAEQLLNFMPQIFPAMFEGSSEAQRAGVAVHHGVRCSACNAEPVSGPRFRCAEAGIDLCGECFIDQGCEISDQFECDFLPPTYSTESDPCKAWSDKDSKRAMKEAWSHNQRAMKEAWKHSEQAWKEGAKVWKEAWKQWKHVQKCGKGWPHCKGKKGKGKAKGWGAPEPHDFGRAAQAAAQAQSGAEDASETMSNASTAFTNSNPPFMEASVSFSEDSCAPPGLEAWCSAWGKGGGKDGSPWSNWMWPHPHHGPPPFPPMHPAFGGWDAWGPWCGAQYGAELANLEQLALLEQFRGGDLRNKDAFQEMDVESRRGGQHDKPDGTNNDMDV